MTNAPPAVCDLLLADRLQGRDFIRNLWYNYNMYNWSVDEKKFKKEDPDGYKIWQLEQMINWGLGGEKLKEAVLRRLWKKLFLDPEKKEYLKFLLWPKRKRATRRIYLLSNK